MGAAFVMPRVKLVVAYDGTGFHGYAAQHDVRTVGGELMGALRRVLRREVVLSCAGRTDAGVHAWGQVVSFDLEPDDGVDLARLQASLAVMLGPEIVVRDAALVDPTFDARHSAKWRHYRYTIVNRQVPDPFLARYAWWVPKPLDLSLLRLGADPFIGEHDFSALSRKGPEGSTRVRTVMSSEWRDRGDGILDFEIRARSFCWQMVRSIVGTLVEVGNAKKRPSDVVGILRSQDRSMAGQVAPPHGLCLREVGY